MQVNDSEALEHLLAQARAFGAETADASVTSRESLSVEVRMGALEGVEREEARSIALRALIGRRQAAAVSTDLSPEGRRALAERVVAMARAAPEDPYCGLLDPALRAVGPPPDLDLGSSDRPDAAALEAMARRAEEAALAVAGIANSNGAGAGWDAGAYAYATADGFFAESHGASFSVGVSPVAERDGQKERDYEGRSRRRLADLPDPAFIGRVAGERAVARLGARKLESRKAAVIFENRIAPRLIGPFLGAIAGSAVARGVSFLKDRMGKPVFAAGFTIEDDPLRPRGPASRAFDGEGAATRRRLLIEDGVLTTWILNAASARQLGLTPTGHATLGHGGPPGASATNVTVVPNRDGGLDALMGDAGQGLLVTDMFSPALNANTGDWSVGVAGFWFEDGARAFPVSEITVAGNLADLYARLIAGGDLERRGALDSPSLLVDDLAIAGR